MSAAPPIIDLTSGGEADGFSIPPNPFASRPRSGNGAITGLVFHHTGPGSLAGVMTSSQTQYLPNGKKNPGYGTGAQYYIDTDGTIYEYGPDTYRAYNIEAPGTKNRADAKAATAALANSNVIGIEIVAPDSEHFTAAQKASAVALGTYLAGKYSIDPSMIVGHGELQSNRMGTEGVNVAELTREALAGGGNTALAIGAAHDARELAAVSIDQLRAQNTARQAFFASAGATAGVVIDGQATGVPPRAPAMTKGLDLGVVDPDMMGMIAPPANDWLGSQFGDVALGGIGSTALSHSGAGIPEEQPVAVPALLPGPVEATKTDRQRTDLANSPATLDQLVRQVYAGTGLAPAPAAEPAAAFPGPPQRWMIETTPVAVNSNIGLVAPVLTSNIAFAPPSSLAQSLSGTPYADMGLAFDHFTVPASVAQEPVQAVPKTLASLETNWKQPPAPAPVAATVKPQPNLAAQVGAAHDARELAASPPAAATVPPVKAGTSAADNSGMHPGTSPSGAAAYPGDMSLGGSVEASKAAAKVIWVTSVPSAKPATQSVTSINPDYAAWEAKYGNQGGLSTGTSAATVSAKFNDSDGVAAPLDPRDMSLGGVPVPPAPPKYITRQVPTSAPKSSAAISAGGYVVQGGDTLSDIARRSGVSLQALQSINGISDPNKIVAGAQLKIPSKANAIPVSATSTAQQAASSSAKYGYLVGGEATHDALMAKQHNGVQIDQNGNPVKTMDGGTSRATPYVNSFGMVN